MSYVHTIFVENVEWVRLAASLLAGVLADQALLLLRRGFGRRRFGRGLGPFRLFRIMRIVFALLFTTVLGPIVLVVLLVAAGYWFFSSRRER